MLLCKFDQIVCVANLGRKQTTNLGIAILSRWNTKLGGNESWDFGGNGSVDDDLLVSGPRCSCRRNDCMLAGDGVLDRVNRGDVNFLDCDLLGKGRC